MRKLHALTVLGVAVAATGCGELEVTENEDPVAYDYILDLPPEFARQNVMGIDSKVEEFRSADTIVSTDFGHYSSPPDCSGAYLACDIEEDELAERDVLIGRYRHGAHERPGEPKPYRVWMHVEVAPRQGLDLNVFARCDTEAACDRALQYLMRTRIVEIDPPPVQSVPPPPPPVAPPPQTR